MNGQENYLNVVGREILEDGDKRVVGTYFKEAALDDCR